MVVVEAGVNLNPAPNKAVPVEAAPPKMDVLAAAFVDALPNIPVPLVFTSTLLESSFFEASGLSSLPNSVLVEVPSPALSYSLPASFLTS